MKTHQFILILTAMFLSTLTVLGGLARIAVAVERLNPAVLARQ